MATGLAFWACGNRENGLSMPLPKVVLRARALVKVIDWIADKAAPPLAQTGRLTVVVLDFGSLHTSLLVRSSVGALAENLGY